MKVYSVDEFLKSPCPDYIILEGFMILGKGYEEKIINDKLEKVYKCSYFLDIARKNNPLETEKNKIVISSFDSALIEKIMDRHNIEKSRMRIFAKVINRPMIDICTILKVELLDEKGGIIDSMRVSESEMPKEFRGKL